MWEQSRETGQEVETKEIKDIYQSQKYRSDEKLARRSVVICLDPQITNQVLGKRSKDTPNKGNNMGKEVLELSLIQYDLHSEYIWESIIKQKSDTEICVERELCSGF